MSSMVLRPNLYEDVVKVTYQYLGPAADRFVARQIRNHLQKEPIDLRRSDLRQLIDWIRLAMSLLSDDQALVAEYVTNLQRLTVPTKMLAGHGKTVRR